MNKRLARLAAFALAVLPILQPVRAEGIGDMWVDDMIAFGYLSDLAPRYCVGGYVYGRYQEALLVADAKYNILWNYPMLFHSIMCRLQHYCEPDFDEDFGFCGNRLFAGCAEPVLREMAATNAIPTLTNRNCAVSVLVPFFASGGTHPVGDVTISPLMHRYGGSPLCVWPASNVVDVTGGGGFVVPAPPNASPLKAGVGRGGCFDVEAWLSCTDAADRPQGFHTGAHPMADLGEYMYATLSPYFDIDWTAKGIPTPAMTNYPDSFFLTNSPTYISAEAVPLVETNRVLSIEPWRRSWEALGGLSCVAWHLGPRCNPFDYDAYEVTMRGEISEWGSNQVVRAMTRYMNAGHPAITNTEYFATNGLSVRREQYWHPWGRSLEGVRPAFDIDPVYILPRGSYKPPGSPISEDMDYDWTARTNRLWHPVAPVSNVNTHVSNVLYATSEKRWRFEKTNEVQGLDQVIDVRLESLDFGYGTHEYQKETYIDIGSSYEWQMVEECDPKTKVTFFSETVVTQTVLAATFTMTNFTWRGLPNSWDGFTESYRDPGGVSTVCRYDDGNSMESEFFVSDKGGDGIFGYQSDMFAFMDMALSITAEGGLEEFLDGNSYNSNTLSEQTYPLARDPTPIIAGDEDGITRPWWDTVWTGAGHEYTITTYGIPQPYSSPCETNVRYVAEYATTNAVTGVVTSWRDTILAKLDGTVYAKEHQQLPAEDTDWEIIGPGYFPGDDKPEAVSKIVFSVENITGSRYRIEWEPVRAWGIFKGVITTYR